MVQWIQYVVYSCIRFRHHEGIGSAEYIPVSKKYSAGSNRNCQQCVSAQHIDYLASICACECVSCMGQAGRASYLPCLQAGRHLYPVCQISPALSGMYPAHHLHNPATYKSWMEGNGRQQMDSAHMQEGCHHAMPLLLVKVCEDECVHVPVAFVDMPYTAFEAARGCAHVGFAAPQQTV